jgi:uncharacterized protein with beta-barrel porin domain
MFSAIDLTKYRKQKSLRRNFQRALLLSSAALVFAPVSSFAQNLIQNPGFETNGCGAPPGQCQVVSSWTISGPTDITAGIGNGGGNGSPWALNPFSGGSISSQTVPVSTAGNYRFSFFYRDFTGSSGLVATVGGTTVFNNTVASQTYQQSVTTLFLPTGPTVVQFSTPVFASELNIDDVSLTLLQTFLLKLLPPNTPINPSNVAAAIDAFTAAGGTLPAGFQSLSNLTPQQLSNALTQLSGENNTQAQQGAFQMTNSFLSLLTDPSSINRMGGSAMGFAPERQSSLPSSIASAYAKYTKAPPMVSYAPRWDVWGAAFGGSNRTSGDPVVVGSHDATSNAGGFAAGADYRISPDRLIGFSLAGGATSWSLSGGLGGGRSDAFLAGIYGKQNLGAGYVSGAATYANYWMQTNRTVTVAGLDQLHADFNAQNFGGRLEGGYRLPNQIWMMQWTPYAAIQGQSFRTPSYGEIATAGSAQFANTYNGRTATAVRLELGGRVDKTIAIDNGGQLGLFGKVAWAHDEISDPRLNVSFIGLPTTSFVVNGAAPAHDLALLTGGAEWRLASGVSFLAKFDGEFGNRSQTYSGTGRIRYTW